MDLPEKSRAPERSILVLVSSTQRRGGEVFGEHLSGALQASGWETGFYALHRSTSGASVSATPLFEESEIGGISGLKPPVVRRLRSVVNERNPDIVLAGGGATLKYSVAALAGMRSRPLLVYSSIGEPEFWAKSSWRRRMLTALLARTDMVTAVSGPTAAQLIESFGVDGESVRVVHPGVPEDFLKTKRLSREGGSLRVLYLGSMSPEKNPFAAVEAVSLMESPVVLRMVGDGPLLDALHERSRHGEPRLEVVGPSNEVGEHLAWADALVLTSKTEGLPGVILEASASGIPVVAFGVGGVSEAVADGESGFVITPDDVAGMARVLDLLARDHELRRTMGDAGRSRIEDGFTMSKAVSRYVRVLDELLGG